MKKIFTLNIVLLLLIFNIIPVLSQPWYNENSNQSGNFYDIQNQFYEYWKDKEIIKGNGWKQFKRWEYFWEQRVYPTGEFPNAFKVLKSYQDFNKNSKNENSFQDLNKTWSEIGPINVPVNKLAYPSTGLGRINIIRIHPTNDNILWAGSSNGGAWSSTDKGQSWKLAEFTDILSLGISDIAISQSNPNLMFIATGDKNGSYMTNAYSIGILKSIDAGKTWNLASQSYKPTDYFLATRIQIHPSNPNIVYFSSSKGIFRTKDAGANWEKVYNSNSIVYDLEFRPGNPLFMYACSSGKIIRSTDGGDTWGQVFAMDGSSRIQLATSPADPLYVYAVGARNSNGSFSGLARSTDGGTTFTFMSKTPNILSIEPDGSGNTGQGTYDLALAASPVDKDLIFVGGIHTWKSTDGGKNWKLLNHWTGSYFLPYVHADQHHIVINPRTLELYNTNDGGIYSSTDNGVNWKDISSGLSVSQYYRINVSPANNDMVIGGTQDNGTFLYKNKIWSQVNGGDGMDCAIDPINDNYVYSSTQNGNLFRSTSGGFNFNRIAGPDLFANEDGSWVTPFVLNPINPASIYIGFRNIYKTTNRGATWVKLTNFSNTPTIRLMEISDIDTNIIYIGVNTSLYKSIDGGKNFSTIKSFQGLISDIACDPANPNRVFITVSGYNLTDKVFEIQGTQIKNITFNLPNISVTSIIVQKNTSGRVYIGTDIGVFLKSDDFSNKWESYSEKLPPTAVNDLKINYSAGKLYAGTFGRGLWETKLYDCNIEKPTIKLSGNIEFCTGDSVKLEAQSIYKQFKWSTGDTTKSIMIRKSGSYFVSVKSENGCTEKSEPVILSELYVPSFAIKSNKEMVLCGNDTISLSVQIGFKEYKWSTGDTTNRINVFEPGYYKITAVSPKGCVVKDSVYIYMRPIPEKPKLYVDGDTLSTDSAKSYKWFFNDEEIPNSNKKSIVAGKSGKYYVLTYNEYLCSNSSESSDIISSVNDLTLKNGFSISPNPFKDYIQISPKDNFSFAEVTITDLLGRKILFDKFENISVGNDLILRLTDVSDGTYILLIKVENQVYSFNIKKFN
jgi:photosystem II stability/assembly factor-like uncharacterized protein